MAKRKVSAPLHSKFYSTIAQSTRFRAEEGESDQSFSGSGQQGRGGFPPKGGPKYSRRERYAINVGNVAQEFGENPARAIKRAAANRTIVETQVAPEHRFIPEEREDVRPRVSNKDVELIRIAEREQKWKTEPNVYKVSRKQDVRPSGGFMREHVAPSHAKWIEAQLQNPQSEFNRHLNPEQVKTGRYTSGQRRRLGIYTDALQQGATHQEALSRVRSSALKENVGRRPSKTQPARRSLGEQAVAAPRHAGRETKFQTLVPSAREFRFGIDATARPKIDDLKRKFPSYNEQQLIQAQQAGTEFISQEMLSNQKWAHETRRANLLGAKSGKTKEDPDKVTIFTTNVGHPAVSVPADSLVGQYIIKKRKSVLGGYGVPASQLRGKFPDAVRDAHIVDVATGASYGLMGRQGVFSNTGYRVGRKASAGYGRPKPLGGHILYDSTTGRPLYDAQGNIRYSEGSTRQVDWTTPTFGARILMG